MDARMRVRYWLKLAIGNVSIAIAILLSLNLVAALLYDGREVLEKTFVPVSEKASQASLEDQEQARTIFREFSQLTTRYVPYVAWSREPFRGELTTVNDEGDRVHTSTTSRVTRWETFSASSRAASSRARDARIRPESKRPPGPMRQLMVSA